MPRSAHRGRSVATCGVAVFGFQRHVSQTCRRPAHIRNPSLSVGFPIRLALASVAEQCRLYTTPHADARSGLCMASTLLHISTLTEPRDAADGAADRIVRLSEHARYSS